MSSPFTFSGEPSSQVVATAIHAGHDLRPEIASLMKLDEPTRLREEDPYTDSIASCADFRVIVSRSRFEVDLNRAPEEAVYRKPEDSWGLDVWQSEPADDVVERSLRIHEDFYRALAAHADQLAARGPFVVLDVHAYNHRRGGPGSESAAQVDNPDVNVGTGSMPDRWREVARSFIATLARQLVRGQRLDVRENIRFEGRQLARWVHDHYPMTGCALAVEFKKTFMDEWSGEPDLDHVDSLTEALRRTIPPTLATLRGAV